MSIRGWVAALAIFGFGVGAFAIKANAQKPVQVSYSKATKAGVGTCPAKYRAVKEGRVPSGYKKTRVVRPALGAAFQHGLTGLCYSCPPSYKRSLNPNIGAKDACVRGLPGRTSSKKADFRGKAKAKKPRGTFFDPRKGGEYWSCRSGTHRTIFPVTSSKACERRAKTHYKRASKYRKNTHIGQGCPRGRFWDVKGGNGLLGACYSCNGYRRSASSVTSSKACYRTVGLARYKAKRHGSVKNPKPRGAFFDPRKGGEYWSCPSAYKRSVVAVTSGKACVQVILPRTLKAVASYRGKKGCPAGSFQNGVYPECYRCPKGYKRSLAIGRDLSKMRNACVKVVVRNPLPDPKFLAWAKKEAGKINRQYAPVFRQIASTAAQVSSKRNIEAYLKAKSDAQRRRVAQRMAAPMLAWIKPRSRRRASLDIHWAMHDYPGDVYLDQPSVETKRKGLPADQRVKLTARSKADIVQLAASSDKVRKSPASEDALPTFTLGMAVDASMVVGVTGGALWAFDTTASGNGRASPISYSSIAYTVGISAGGDTAPEFGLWNPLNHSLAGDSHGFVIGATFKGGVGLTYWWDYKGKFQGFTLVPQIGFSAEAEYIRGRTTIGQKGLKYTKDEN